MNSKKIKHHQGIRDLKKLEYYRLSRQLNEQNLRRQICQNSNKDVQKNCDKKRNSLEELDKEGRKKVEQVRKRQNQVAEHQQTLHWEKGKNTELKQKNNLQTQENFKHRQQIIRLETQHRNFKTQRDHYNKINSSLSKKISQKKQFVRQNENQIQKEQKLSQLLRRQIRAKNSDEKFQAEQQLLKSLNKHTIDKIMELLNELDEYGNEIEVVGQHLSSVQCLDQIKAQTSKGKNSQEINKKVKDVETKVDRLKFEPAEKYNRLQEIFKTIIDLTNRLQDKEQKQSTIRMIEIKIKFIRYFFQQKGLNSQFVPPIPEMSTIKDKSKTLTDRSQLGRPVGQLLQQLKLQEKQKNELRQTYIRFESSYKRFQSYNKEDVFKQAYKLKNKLKISSDLPTILALMNRANKIVDGYELRPAQVLTVIIFFSSYGMKINRACEVKTGQGKTTIISLIAVIETLRGRFVDVITSNEVLAADAVDLKHGRTEFYALFGISATHNNADPTYTTGSRNCYNYNIVYGTIGNFQFDYLKNKYELKQTKGTRRQSSVIIDQADNVVLDNAAHTAKLSEPIYGLGYMKIVYLHIWVELAKAEEQLGLRDKQFYEINDNHKQEIKRKLNNIQFKQIVPDFLLGQCNRKKQVWIQNAILAMYDFHNKIDYIISKKQQDKNSSISEQMIIPLDNLVGATLQNTKLTHLHPFLQLKHNLQLSEDSLSSIFIANCEYINLYSKIFGLTGTLGSKREKTIFKEIYNAECVVVPSFKKNQLKFQTCYIAKDRNEWIQLICDDVKQKAIEKNRAILVICSTVYDLQTISSFLKNQFSDLKLVEYKDQRDASIIQNLNSAKIQEGTVILSTNIGGRGTDLKLSEKVLKKQGLHVIVTFCACQRVLKQAVGRAGRQGQPGTAKIIIQQSDMLKFNIQLNQQFKVHEIFQAMDLSQTKRNQTQNREIIRKIQLIRKCHQIFLCFGGCYAQCKAKKMPHMILEDLKAQWAFAFDSKEQDRIQRILLRIKNASAKSWFYQQNHKFVNPVYAISHVEVLLNGGGNARTEDTNQIYNMCQAILNQDCVKNQSYPMIQASRDLLMFRIRIMKMNSLENQFNKIVEKIILFFTLTKNNNMVEQAKTYLQSALKNLENGSRFEQTFIKEDYLQKIILPPENLDYKGENYLLLHLKSRSALTSLRLQYVKYLTQAVQQNKNKSIYIQKVFTLEQLMASIEQNNQHNNQTLKGTIRSAQIKESESQGQVELCELNFIKEISISDSAIKSGLGKIGGGIAILFLSALPVVGMLSAPVGNGLIIDGVIDILTYIITRQDHEFNFTECIASSGLDVLTFGLAKLFKLLKIFKRIGKLAAKASTKVAKCRFLGKFSSKLGDKLKRLGDKLKAIKPKGKLKTKPKIKPKQFVNLGLQLVANTQLFNQIVSLLEQYIKTPIENKLQQLLNPFMQKFQSLQSLVKTCINNCFSSIMPASLEDKFASRRSSIEQDDREQLEEFFGSLSDKVERICDKVTSNFSVFVEMYHNVKDFFELGLQYFLNPIISVIKSLKKDKIGIITAVRDICSGDFLNSIIECISTFKDSVVSTIQKLMSINLIPDIADDIRALTETIFNMPQVLLDICTFDNFKNTVIMAFSSLIGENPLATFAKKMGLNLSSPRQVCKDLIKKVWIKVKHFVMSNLKKTSKRNPNKRGLSEKEEDRQKLQQYYASRKQNDCVVVAIKLMLQIQNAYTVYSYEIKKGLTIKHAEILLSRLMGEDVKFEKNHKIVSAYQNSAKRFLNTIKAVSGLAFMKYTNNPVGHAYCIEKEGQFHDHKGKTRIQDNDFQQGTFLSVKELTDEKRTEISKRWNGSRKRCRQFDSLFDHLLKNFMLQYFGQIQKIGNNHNKYPCYPRIVAGLDENFETFDLCQRIHRKLSDQMELDIEKINNNINKFKVQLERDNTEKNRRNLNGAQIKRSQIKNIYTGKIIMIGAMKVKYTDNTVSYLCAFNNNHMKNFKSQVDAAWSLLKQKRKITRIDSNTELITVEYDEIFSSKQQNGIVKMINGKQIENQTLRTHKTKSNFKGCAAQQMLHCLTKNLNGKQVSTQNGAIEMCEFAFVKRCQKVSKQDADCDQNVIASCQHCETFIPIIMNLSPNQAQREQRA